MEKEKNASDVTSVVPELAPVDAAEQSDARLQELGYKSEFRRDMSLFGVLGISFCAIGILTGMSSAFQTGLFSGGPLGLFWGWNVRRVSCLLLSKVLIRGRVTDLQFLHAAHCHVPCRDLQCIVSSLPFIIHICA